MLCFKPSGFITITERRNNIAINEFYSSPLFNIKWYDVMNNVWLEKIKHSLRHPLVSEGLWIPRFIFFLSDKITSYGKPDSISGFITTSNCFHWWWSTEISLVSLHSLLWWSYEVGLSSFKRDTFHFRLKLLMSMLFLMSHYTSVSFPVIELEIPFWPAVM